jgi:peptide chain release factor 2
VRLFNTAKLKSELKRLQEIQNGDGFWNDMKTAQQINKEAKLVKSRLTRYEDLIKRADDLEVMTELIEEHGAEEELPALNEDLKALNKDAEMMRVETLLSGKYDILSAILSLHAGAGGTEAQDWVSMLYKMYSRYAEKAGYSVKVLDVLDGDEAGIKSITFSVSGEYAYGYLKAEKGVHRLVRISPFDANKRRHTSFASLDVMPEIEDDDEIVIAQEDLRIDTYRSGGAGGQHVNKTDSAVRITHLPTGIVVQCQNERSQIQNREVAMKMLKSKLLELKEQQRLEQESELKGDLKKIEWGSQIRSYVFCPYTMVKDHRTNYETGNIQAVMDGEIEDFIVEYLKRA